MTIAFEDILQKTVADACVALSTAPRKKLAAVTLFDLILGDSGLHTYLHGVYLIFAQGGDPLLYVGRVHGPQFIERFPAHFALGTGSWQNVFVKRHQEATGAPDLASAAQRAADCELLLLLSPPMYAAKLEALFLRFLGAKYYRRKERAGLPPTISPCSTVASILNVSPVP
jgi:hypothetical protein